jgi:hypothetical protein
MIAQRLKILILTYLFEDTSLFLNRLAGARPLWFRLLVWLPEFSTLTRCASVLAVLSLTTPGWICLLAPPLLNLGAVSIIHVGYHEARAFQNPPVIAGQVSRFVNLSVLFRQLDGEQPNLRLGRDTPVPRPECGTARDRIPA